MLLEQAAARGAVEDAVRSYRDAMRRFATMRNLELWYADQNERDHAAVEEAARAGRIAVERGA